MDPRDVIVFTAMASEAARMRRQNRRRKNLLRAAQVALQEKANECEMLKRKKQSMVVKESAMRKLVHDFMQFVEAIDTNDVKNAQNFDEKAMMNDTNSGGFVADDGKKEPNLKPFP